MGDDDGEEPRGPSVDMGWFGDVFELEVETWRWRKLLDTQASTSSPAARAAHACCFFGPGGGQQAGQRGEYMFLFGGRTAAGRVNDTWVLDLGTKVGTKTLTLTLTLT